MKRSFSRNVQLIRTLSIIRDLDRMDGIDLYELADRYGTNLRTIRRDLEGIEAAGLPLADEPAGKRKRWRIAYRDRMAKLSTLLDVSHYLALRVAMEGAVRSSSLFATLEDLAGKIEGAVGRADLARLEAIEAAFLSFEKRLYKEAAPELLWPLVTAIAEERLCVVRYTAARPDAAAKEIRLLPLKLFVHDRALYLHAYVPKHRSVITLNLQRMKALKVTSERARPPKGYHPSKWEAGAFGVYYSEKESSYRLRFSREIAPLIRERTWHPTQKLSALPGGGVELSFTTGASPEVTAWVASWREHVEVLAPESLRAELRALAAWLGRTYS